MIIKRKVYTSIIIVIVAWIWIMSCMSGSTTNSNQNQKTIFFTPSISEDLASQTADEMLMISLERSCPNGFININPTKWKSEKDEQGFQILTNLEISNCLLQQSGGRGYAPNTPQKREYLGIHNWWILDEYYDTSYIMDDNEGALGDCEVIFRIPEQEDGNIPDMCLNDVREVLATFTLQGVEDPGASPLPTFTLRPTVSCPLAPPTVFFGIGDRFVVVRNVYLRATPSKLDNNMIRLLLPGTEGKILEDPICGEFTGGAYVYWKVRLDTNEIGWVAEADDKGPYIEEVMQWGP